MNASCSMALSKPARTFQDLLVWQKAHQFVLAVYALTTAFPKHETYGLSRQLRRASVSIPANIAEGHPTALSGPGRSQPAPRRVHRRHSGFRLPAFDFLDSHIPQGYQGRSLGYSGGVGPKRLPHSDWNRPAVGKDIWVPMPSVESAA